MLTRLGNPAIQIYENSYLSLASSTITNSHGQYAVEIYESNADISSSTFSGGDNVGFGLYGANLKLDHSVISHFTSGLYSFDEVGSSSTFVSIRNSEISNNQFGIKSWGNGNNFSISTSTIYGNTSYGIYNYDSNQLSAENNWWGDPSGPKNQTANPKGMGNSVSDNVLVSPWQVSWPPVLKDPCCSNVLFIPGIETSRLYSGNSTTTEKRLWEPNMITSTVPKLFLNTDGTSQDSSIHVKDVIATSSICNCFLDQDVYADFNSFMDLLKKNGTINDWQTVPYDWRLDMNSDIDNGIQYPNGVI